MQEQTKQEGRTEDAESGSSGLVREEKYMKQSGLSHCVCVSTFKNCAAEDESRNLLFEETSTIYISI